MSFEHWQIILVLVGVICWIVFHSDTTQSGSATKGIELTQDQKDAEIIQKIKIKHPKAGWIYILERDGFYKIGKTDLNVKQDEFIGRFKQYNGMTHVPEHRSVLNIIYFAPCGNAEEMEKKVFKKYELFHHAYITGEEWFHKNAKEPVMKIIPDGDNHISKFVGYIVKLFPLQECIQFLDSAVGYSLEKEEKKAMNNLAVKNIKNHTQIKDKTPFNNIYLHPEICS